MRSGISDSTVERFHAFLGEEDQGRARAIGALDAFFAAASAALLLLDRDLHCVQANERLSRLTRLPLEEHRDRPVRELVPVALESKLREILQSGEPLDKEPIELDGRSLLGTFFPVFDANHNISGLGGILIDYTEHKRLEAELRSAIEIRERVLAVVSHDLRNPLGTIELAVSTLPESARDDREAARRIEIIERATKLMETLIGDLLDMATIQTGTLALHFADENADAVVREAIELHHPLAEEAHLRLVDETHLEGVRVRCDKARVLQVLGNLIGNAIKFCKRGDAITVRGYADGRSLVLEVVDTGPGIPAADIPHLFEQYWSTARGRQRGTGLGLFISHAIVAAHGGELTVASTLGVGTSFRIVLPLG
ncbi:MAG TPA: ATP-binding protein [Kofleriaceae bacterium]|nr:ATP-binding protein [Kofleriaceae bacterium]